MFACGRLSAISARFFFNRGGGGCYPSRTLKRASFGSVVPHFFQININKPN